MLNAMVMAKQEVNTWTDTNLKRAYFMFKNENNRAGMAVVIDEVQNRYPAIFNEMYDNETFEIDEMEFISKAIKGVS